MLVDSKIVIKVERILSKICYESIDRRILYKH